ncbi:MAG: transposase [Janthinobacterium lividum]
MARLPRLYVPGEPQSILLAGGPAFLDDGDYRFYLDCLRMAAREGGVAIHAYSLTPEAVRLLATPSHESAMPTVIQALGRRYVAHFNRRHQRAGKLWNGRYRATVLEADRYFLACSRFVETAPVGAGHAPDSEIWRWSSYAHHVGMTVDPVITDHPAYWALGNTPFERQHAYRQLCESPLPAPLVQEIASATEKGWALGSDEYRARCARLASRRLAPLKRGRPRPPAALDGNHKANGNPR